MQDAPSPLETPSVMARALWFDEPGSCRLRVETIGVVQDADDLMVRTLFSGISRGTESLVFQGSVPASEQARMRGPNMGGSFSFPVKYGYAAVGIVEAGPEALIGQPVFCLHPHQDRFIVKAASALVIPAGIPLPRAILAANMETALNIVWDAGILPGDRVAVFGAGVVGALVAHIASGIPGTETVLVDRNERRQALAAHLGIPFCGPAHVGENFDVLVNASASDEALDRMISAAGVEARLVEASWYGDRNATLSLGGTFHANRLSIVSSQVGMIPPARRARWTYRRRMTKALDLLADDRLDALISGETAFADLETDYPRILAVPETLCHRIRY